MDLGNLLRLRRNVYGFIQKSVAERTLRTVLEDAIHVPSAGFTQDFDFVVVRDESMKKKLAEAANEDEYVKMGRAQTGFISHAPVVVVPCANKPRFESKYGAPAEKNARLPWWVVDSSFATLALILSAFENGLAASFIGAIDDRKVMQALSLPSDSSIIPLAIILIGHKDPNESSSWKKANREKISERRREFADVVHWDRW